MIHKQNKRQLFCILLLMVFSVTEKTHAMLNKLNKIFEANTNVKSQRISFTALEEFEPIYGHAVELLTDIVEQLKHHDTIRGIPPQSSNHDNSDEPEIKEERETKSDISSTTISITSSTLNGEHKREKEIAKDNDNSNLQKICSYYLSNNSDYQVLFSKYKVNKLIEDFIEFTKSLSSSEKSTSRRTPGLKTHRRSRISATRETNSSSATSETGRSSSSEKDENNSKDKTDEEENVKDDSMTASNLFVQGEELRTIIYFLLQMIEKNSEIKIIKSTKILFLSPKSVDNLVTLKPYRKEIKVHCYKDLTFYCFTIAFMFFYFKNFKKSSWSALLRDNFTQLIICCSTFLISEWSAGKTVAVEYPYALLGGQVQATRK